MRRCFVKQHIFRSSHPLSCASQKSYPTLIQDDLLRDLSQRRRSPPELRQWAPDLLFVHASDGGSTNRSIQRQSLSALVTINHSIRIASQWGNDADLARYQCTLTEREFWSLDQSPDHAAGQWPPPDRVSNSPKTPYSTPGTEHWHGEKPAN